MKAATPASAVQPALISPRPPARGSQLPARALAAQQVLLGWAFWTAPGLRAKAGQRVLAGCSPTNRVPRFPLPWTVRDSTGQRTNDALFCALL